MFSFVEWPLRAVRVEFMLLFYLAALESDADRQVFTSIYSQYHIQMENTAIKILKTQSDAEDAVQNAFMQVIRHFEKIYLIPSDELPFWLISIVKNEAYMILRKQKRMELKYKFCYENKIRSRAWQDGPSIGGQKLFQTERVVIGVCPRCGEPVYEGRKNYYCSNRDCQFVMWKNDSFFQERKKKFTPRIAALLKDGKVKIKGMFSVKTGKIYGGTVL